MSKTKGQSEYFDENEKIITGDGDDAEVTFDGTDVSISTSAGISIKIVPGTGTGKLILDGMNFPLEDGDNNDALVTDGAGQMAWGYDPPPVVNDRGVFGGGYASTADINVMSYITISTTGNATDFGDLTVARDGLGGTSNGNTDRGVFGGGNSGNVIDYITISTASNATNFGDLVGTKNPWATSNGTNDRGIFIEDDASADTIEYITISTTGNATEFGNISLSIIGAAACSNGTNERGISAGGYYNISAIDNMYYFTISTPSAFASAFGDLVLRTSSLTGTDNGTNNRGIFAGGIDAGIGNTNTNVINYITISTTGNATDFGDLTAARRILSGTSNRTNERGVFGGGLAATYSNILDYITINTPGNATDFGNLTISPRGLSAASNV